jgi:ribosomal protein S18 acetylase RimI-like enzyme
VSAVRVRDASPADADAVARVARASWTETYRDIFDAQIIKNFLATNYAPAALATAALTAAARDDDCFLVAERGGAVVGFAHFGRGPRGPELYRIYADPAHYRTGVGSALLENLHGRIAGRIESYVLDVHSKNARARAFYVRQGFVPVGEGVTQDGHMTLRKTLTGPARP